MVSVLEVSKRPPSVLHPLHVFSSWLWCETSKRDFKASSKEREECLCEENVNTWSLSAQSNYLSQLISLWRKQRQPFTNRMIWSLLHSRADQECCLPRIRCKLWDVLECSGEAKVRNGERHRDCVGYTFYWPAPTQGRSKLTSTHTTQ